MSLFEVLAILAAGGAAGAINVVVGSGTLITFPVLLAFGFPPVIANVSNSLGLVPGSLAGAYAYRRELDGQGRRLVRLGCASLLGAATGAVLLLSLPPTAFRAIVPGFILLALVLIIAQPRLARIVAARATPSPRRHAGGGVVMLGAIYLTGVYGGYFGAAQGIMLLAILGLGLDETLHRVNAAKNVLAGLANLLAGVIFAFAAHPDWTAVALLAAGSVLGGTLTGRYGRHLHPTALRALIVAVGIVAAVRLL
ncbi:MAG: sulfite exporter TauE/SafE family protein [Solirubrobacteraceae bacterium]